MADSGAARQARYKRHKAGDHSLCRHDRPSLRVLPPVPAPDDFDPVAEMRALAARLVTATAAEPGNAALARELRATLAALSPGASGLDPELAELLREFPRALG